MCGFQVLPVYSEGFQAAHYYGMGCPPFTTHTIVIRGSVRSGSGLSPEGCNFSRFLESGFQRPNIFQLLYYDVVREDLTKKSPDHLF